jgi:endonuclease III
VISAAGWSSLVARRAHNPKVTGSNPVPATKESPGQDHNPTRASLVLRPGSTGFVINLSSRMAPEFSRVRILVIRYARLGSLGVGIRIAQSGRVGSSGPCEVRAQCDARPRRPPFARCAHPAWRRACPNRSGGSGILGFMAPRPKSDRTAPCNSALSMFVSTFQPLRLVDILRDRPDEAEFVLGNPFGFLIGLLADQNVRVETAWSLPLRLGARIGSLSPTAVARLDGTEVCAIISSKPALHRYPGVMGPRIRAAADRVLSHHDGDAAALWRHDRPAIDVAKDLIGFQGIGPKKASLGAQMAIRDLGARLTDSGLLDVAIDSHVRRVLQRYWGSTGSDNDIRHLARLHQPSSPAGLTPPTWVIGREWCRPLRPKCSECPLSRDCASAGGISAGLVA